MAQPALAEWAGRELYPGEAVQSDAEITDYIRKTHSTVYHPAGTVRMGAAGDPISHHWVDVSGTGLLASHRAGP